MDIHGVYTEVLVRWMERIEAGEPPLILGDGNQTMDFVYVDDIARANLLAARGRRDRRGLQRRQRDVETSLNELAATLLQVMGSDLEPEYAADRKVNAVSGASPTPPGRRRAARLRTPRSASRRGSAGSSSGGGPSSRAREPVRGTAPDGRA